MDELESRLADGLSRHAADLPRYEGDVRKVTRRGRNRRWAARGAGAVGALALLGGGVVAYQSIGDPGQTLATEDPGVLVPAPTVTPTPTPEPTPETTPEPTPDTTPEPGATPAPEQIRDVFAVSATGWGVGLVGSGGDFFTTLTCCDGDDWTTQPAGGPALGAVRVRDDLAGGLVASTSNTLWWQPETARGAPIALDTVVAESPEAEVRVDLWDVQLIDDRLRILYSTAAIDAEGGVARLFVAEVVGGTPTEPIVLAEQPWQAGDGTGFVWAGAGWVATGGHMELRSAVDIGCEWVTYVDTDPAFESPFAPPDPDAGCPQDSIGGAAVNAEGQLVVIERFLSQPPATAQLAVYDRVGNLLSRTDLPETLEGQPRWTEIDVVGSAVLVSRTTTTDLSTDEVLRVDLDSSGPARTLPFLGNPTFARSNISTADLTLVRAGDARWFGTVDEEAAEPPPEPEDETPEPTPASTPAAGPSPTPEPSVAPEPDPEGSEIPDESRIPTGRFADIKDAGTIIGDGGCLETICVGLPIDEALQQAGDLYGDEDGDSPEARWEGEPPEENEHVFITDSIQVWIVESIDRVRSVRAWPAPDGDGAPLLAGPEGDPLTVGDLLAKHGAPAEVVNGVGEGIQVLWLFYDTTGAYVAYGVTLDGDDTSPLLAPGDPSLPPEYDDLVINSYWARPAD